MPKIQQVSSMGNLFVIFVLLLFFLILYSSFDLSSGRETFAQQQCPSEKAGMGRKLDDQLLDPERMEIYQGVSIPNKYKPTKTDVSDPAAPSIDGEPDSLRSMNMFSFNKCAPECCLESPYSCDRGCVCITPKQYQFLDKRGDNRQPNACNFERKI
jgi:hypothetical protein